MRDSFLGQFSLESIHTELAKMKEDEELKPAKMNNGWVNSDIRGDLIRMVSSDEVDKLPIFTQALIFQLDAIRQDLNKHLNFGSEKVQIQVISLFFQSKKYHPPPQLHKLLRLSHIARKKLQTKIELNSGDK